jgi:hypothetical protein
MQSFDFSLRRTIPRADSAEIDDFRLRPLERCCVSRADVDVALAA